MKPISRVAGPPGGSSFPPTAWTLVGEMAAGGSAGRKALEAVARAYWKPVYVYLRRKGRLEADAADCVQSFFLHLIEKDLLGRPDPSRGKFRHWLRAVLEHFLANEARIGKAQKRGGGRRPLSLDPEVGERAVRAGSDLSPEEAFDRAWALEVLDRAFGRLEREYDAAGKGAVIAVLRSRMGRSAAGGPPAAADDVAVHRARKRLRAIIIEEVGDSVRDPRELSSEVADLFRSLGRNP